MKNLAAIEVGGLVSFQLGNLHGDIIAISTATVALLTYAETSCKEKW